MLSMSAEEQRIVLDWMREAEVKHARLAMLAAVGWPLAELWNPLALVTTDGRAPSIFNGGLGDGIVAPFLLLAFAYGASIELSTTDNAYQTWLRKDAKDYVAGDLGYDPVGYSTGTGLAQELPDFLPHVGDKNALLEAEIKNGRVAMLAITGFAVQEFLWGNPVVQQTPWFFGK